MPWELVYRDENQVLERTPIQDGWIYRYQLRQGSSHGGYDWVTSICFVPAPAAPPP